MGLFTRSKITSDEYADLSSKIVAMNTDIAILKGTMERIETRFKALHTKIARMKDDDEEEPQKPLDLADMQRQLLGMQ